MKPYLDMESLKYYDKYAKKYINNMKFKFNKSTTCPNCGAAITSSKCEYCGADFEEGALWEIVE